MPDQDTPIEMKPTNAIPLGLFSIHGDPGPLFAALAAAQADYAPIVRDKEVTVQTKRKDGSPGPTYKFKYAPIQNLKEACTPALSKNGLTVIQPFSRDSDGFTLRTILAHSSGAYIEAIVDGPNGDSWQALGSALTYASRYSYAGITGCVADDDDDGNAADGNEVTHHAPKNQPPKAPGATQKAAPAPKPAAARPAPKASPVASQATATAIAVANGDEPDQGLPPEACADDAAPKLAIPPPAHVTPDTERAIIVALRECKDPAGKPYTMNSGRARIREIVGRETRYQNDAGQWDTSMTEAEGQLVVKTLRGIQ